jgi:SSS family solute:Na+ symporter
MFKDTLSSDQYLQAYPMLVKAVLPTVFTGFFAAVMVGAVLSTFNSVLNSAATLYSKGVYSTVIKPSSSGLEQVRIGRWCSALLALAAMAIAPMIDTSGSLYVYLQQINATFFGPMLAVILCGFLTTRVTAQAAKVGLIAGPVIFYLLNFSFADQYQNMLQATFGLSEPTHFLHTLALVFVLTLGVLFVISAISPEKHVPEAKAAPEQVVDLTPWRFARAAGIAISLVTLTCYIALAQ